MNDCAARRPAGMQLVPQGPSTRRPHDLILRLHRIKNPTGYLRLDQAMTRSLLVGRIIHPVDGLPMAWDSRVPQGRGYTPYCRTALSPTESCPASYTHREVHCSLAELRDENALLESITNVSCHQVSANWQLYSVKWTRDVPASTFVSSRACSDILM